MKRLAIMLAALLVAGGCQSQSKVNEERQDNGFRPITVKNSAPKQSVRQSGSDKANHLALLAGRVDGVQNANAVVIGNYAIVGLDVDSGLDRSRVGTLKYSVAEALKEDPHGANALIVADPDVNARLQEINDDMKAGKPVQGILNELADIIGRVMPDVPDHMIDTGREPREAPRDGLSQNDQRALQREAENQSHSGPSEKKTE